MKYSKKTKEWRFHIMFHFSCRTVWSKDMTRPFFGKSTFFLEKFSVQCVHGMSKFAHKGRPPLWGDTPKPIVKYAKINLPYICHRFIFYILFNTVVNRIEISTKTKNKQHCFSMI
jgi:hypothetical protein